MHLIEHVLGIHIGQKYVFGIRGVEKKRVCVGRPPPLARHIFFSFFTIQLLNIGSLIPLEILKIPI